MKAATQPSYGPADILEIRDMPRPEPGPTEVLVEVHASAVTTADWRLRASAFPGGLWLVGRLVSGLFRPRHEIPGVTFSGRVTALGASVTKFAVGDAVFGFAGHGGHAEYLALSQDAAMARKPEALSHAEAAAIPFGAMSALVFLRDIAKLRPGERILIVGASGGVGASAVQLARHFGADVTGVAGPDSLDLVRSLGAERVIDYTRQDPAKAGQTWDVILDTVGATSFPSIRHALAPTGRWVPLEFGLGEAGQALMARMRRGPKVKLAVSGDSAADLEYLADLVETGTLRAVIDSSFPLDRIADAHRRVETRHAKGAVILALRPDATLRAVA